MKIYRINVDVYTDTRMGATNPNFDLKPAGDLIFAKKRIIDYLFSKYNSNPAPFEIVLENGRWTKDFVPEIITVIETELE